MKTRLLFIATAVVEFPVGFALILFPSLISGLLFGLTQSSVAGIIVSRIAGAALTGIAIACFVARNDEGSLAAKGLVAGISVYNIIASATLLYVGFSLQFSFILASAIIIHAILLIWCGTVLLPFATDDTKNTEGT